MGAKENEREHKYEHLQLVIDLARRHKSADTRKVYEIAEWMAAEVKRRGMLHHHEAADAVRKRMSPYLELIRPKGLISREQERDDRNGSIREVYRFGPAVLDAFKELTGKTVRWGKNDRYWVAVKPKQARRA